MTATGTRQAAATGGIKGIGLGRPMRAPVGLGRAMTDGNFMVAIGMAIADGSTTITIGIINTTETGTVITIGTRLGAPALRHLKRTNRTQVLQSGLPAPLPRTLLCASRRLIRPTFLPERATDPEFRGEVLQNL
ncbi:MAG TPA: hypothetical protein VK525_19105 [Candidatus Saccharimonadales bacterium]|nr:hypothetical protein [Candidatus Saccharimonadales bacterium]